MTSSSVQSLSRVRLFVTPWTAACQASLSITNSRSPPKLMSMESAMPSNRLILCRPLLLQPSVFPSIRVLKDEEVLRKPKRGVGGARPRQPGRRGWCQHKNLTARAKTRSSSEPPRRHRCGALDASFVLMTPTGPEGCGLPDVEMQSSEPCRGSWA